VFLLTGMNQSHPLGLQFCGAESMRYKQPPEKRPE
jgi:hypothetical protein